MRIIFLFAFIFISNFGFSQKVANEKDLPSDRATYEKEYASRIKKEFLYGTYIPKDVEDAIVQLNKKLETAAIKQFTSFTEEQVRIKGGLKLWILNNWGFYYGSRLSHTIKQLGILHPDDMAEFVMICYHRRLNNKDLLIKEQVDSYIEKRAKLMEEKKKKAVLIKEEVKKKN